MNIYIYIFKLNKQEWNQEQMKKKYNQLEI